MDLFDKLTITGGNEGADIKITNQRTEEGIFFAALSVPKSGMLVLTK